LTITDYYLYWSLSLSLYLTMQDTNNESFQILAFYSFIINHGHDLFYFLRNLHITLKYETKMIIVRDSFRNKSIIVRDSFFRKKISIIIVFHCYNQPTTSLDSMGIDDDPSTIYSDHELYNTTLLIASSGNKVVCL
jgi:hypothetical protein